MNDITYLIGLLQASPPSRRDSNTVQELQFCLSKLGLFIHDPSDLQMLAREVDVATVDNGRVVYMQGEAGTGYFVVLRGAVDLYVEQDSDVERSALQQLAPHDLQVVPEDGRCVLGNIVTELQGGSGFGEHALLAKDVQHSNSVKVIGNQLGSPKIHKNKVCTNGDSTKCNPAQCAGRAHSAVSAAEDTALLVIHESTYRKVVQKHHIEQHAVVASALALWRLPLLRHGTFAGALQVAQHSQPLELPYRAPVAAYQATIDKVFLVLEGEVRVSGAPTSPQRKSLFESSSSVDSASIATNSLAESHSPTSTKFPPVTISVLRAGQVVGEMEVLRGLSAFKFNYEVLSLHAKLLLVSIDAYLECARDCAFSCPGAVVFSATALTGEEAAQRKHVRSARCAEIDAFARALRKQQRSLLTDSAAGASLDCYSAAMLSDFGSPARPGRLPGSSLSTVECKSSSLWTTPQRTQLLASAAQRSSTASPQQQRSPRVVRFGEFASPSHSPSPSPRQWGEALPSPRPPRSPKVIKSGTLASTSPRQVSPRYLRGGSRNQDSDNHNSDAGQGGDQEGLQCFQNGADSYAAVEARAMEGTEAGKVSVPSRCMDYAVTPAEAARRVREELQAIRRRLAVKSTDAV